MRHLICFPLDKEVFAAHPNGFGKSAGMTIRFTIPA